MFLTIDNVHNILQSITTVYHKSYKWPSEKARLQSHIALYMDRQSLLQYFPEIHIRIDAEGYMKRQNSGFNLIEYRMTDDELASYDAWLQDAKITSLSALNYCASKEVKVSFTFSTDKESWCVSFTGREDNKHNAGATLTSWSDDPLDALYMAVYKSTVIFSDGTWKTRKSSNRG